VISLTIPLLVALLVGHVFDRGILLDPGRGLIERCGRALALGLGLLGTVSMVCDALGFGVSATTVGVGTGLLMLSCLIACWRKPGPSASEVQSSASRLAGLSLGEKAAWLGLLLFAAVGIGLAVRSGWIRQTFQFDALVRWMFKTKVLALEGTLLGRISTDPEFAMTHQRYPPMVAHVANLPALVSGVFNDRIASAMYPWFAVALVASTYGAVARRVGLVTGALAAAWIAHLPIVSFVIAPPPGAGAFSAMADIPLALFLTGAVLAAADAVDGQRARAHVEAGVMLGFALLTKNEAVPLVAAMGLALLVAAPRARWRRAFGVCGIGVVVFLVGWGVVSRTLPSLDENYPAQLSVDAIVAGFQRLGAILPELFTQFIDLRTWNVTWPAALALVVVAGAQVWHVRGLRLLAVVLLIQLGSYVFAYMITAWSSPAAEVIEASTGGARPVVLTLMRVTVDRLLVQIAPAFVAMALIASPLSLRRSG